MEGNYAEERAYPNLRKLHVPLAVVGAGSGDEGSLQRRDRAGVDPGYTAHAQM